VGPGFTKLPVPDAAAGKLVAVYARISVNENGERDESLETQCDLLSGFVRENGLGRYRLYIDNNESGTCFDRPGLLRLVEDIKSGFISTLVVKDLSRLGRNNGETLTFLDFLKENNVRLISIGDSYDSFFDDDEIVGIKTWVNEHYARDISKKVRANLKKKMQNGEYLGRPHFGYIKSDTEKNRLVVDERYREIIQEIFSLYIKGWGYRALADYMQGRGIPTPSQDKNYPGAKKSSRWNEQHIRRIITNRVYCGDTVQSVSEKVSFKLKKTRRLPPERWVVVENTHEAVISREVFDLAQRVRAKRWLEGAGRKKKKDNGQHLFSGFLACAACGSYLVYKKKKNRPAFYLCSRYNRFGRKDNGCTSHRIFEDELVGYLVEDVERLAGGKFFQDRLADEYKKSIKMSVEETARRIKQLEARVAEKKRQQKRVYLDKVKGIVTEGLFIEANAEIEKEIAILESGIGRLKEEMAASGRVEENSLKLSAVNLRVNAGDIDRIFLEKYVRKIIIAEDEEEINGTVREKYGLDSISAGKQPVIILYELSPVN